MLRISAFIKVGCGEDEERIETDSDESASNKEKKTQLDCDESYKSALVDMFQK